MPEKRSNPRLLLRLIALIVVIAGLLLAFGLPMLLTAMGGTPIGDGSETAYRSMEIAGGAIGIAAALFLGSFLLRPKN